MAKKNKKKPQPHQVISRQTESKKMSLQARTESFSGPIPPPAILSQYNEIVPDAAERIVKMAENQAKHRQQLEKSVIESDIKNSRLGLHYGLIIGLVAVIGGVACIYTGYEVGGSIVGGTGLTGLVGVFVYGSTQRRKEREARSKAELMSAEQH